MKQKYKRYSKEELQKAADSTSSIRALLLYFGLKETGGNHVAMSKRLRIMDIDISHFTGKAWSLGKTKHTNDSINFLSKNRTISDKDILVSNCPHRISNHRLRECAKKHIPYSCSECLMEPVWRNKALTLHLDHLDGNNLNNNIENLRFLCPNCHQQTPTWGNKKVPT